MASTPSASRLKRPGRKRSRLDWQRTLRYYYWRFLRLQGSSQEISRGLASGVFAGCFPLFGLQMIIGVAIATVIRGNRIMAAAGTWISNPLTYVPLFAFNYQIGHWVLGGGPAQRFTDLDTLKGWMEMGTEVTTRLMLGSAVVGLIASVTSYYLGTVLITRLHQRRRHERATKRLRVRQ
ncbi:MAG TPA: DUF2062 domain-containing protein [Leptolyngbyaceae cyanobacterium]